MNVKFKPFEWIWPMLAMLLQNVEVKGELSLSPTVDPQRRTLFTDSDEELIADEETKEFEGKHGAPAPPMRRSALPMWVSVNRPSYLLLGILTHTSGNLLRNEEPVSAEIEEYDSVISSHAPNRSERNSYRCDRTWQSEF